MYGNVVAEPISSNDEAEYVISVFSLLIFLKLFCVSILLLLVFLLSINQADVDSEFEAEHRWMKQKLPICYLPPGEKLKIEPKSKKRYVCMNFYNLAITFKLHLGCVAIIQALLY